jgi:phosphatidylglycerophosphatase A
MTEPRPSLSNPAVLLATVFGIGWLPKAPGTWGSLAALPAAWWLMSVGGVEALAVASVVVFAIGVWACGGYSKATGTHDAGACVIDEVVGQWIVLLVVPLDPMFYAAAFLVFRFFDIVKPWPTGWADRAVHGGFGVMLDDVLAGIQGAVVMGLALWAIAALG